ncbi:MAG: GYF domain-containing protein [Myxococcota bacterium]
MRSNSKSPSVSGMGAGARRSRGNQVPAASTALVEAWHIAIRDVPVGPVTRSQIRHQIQAGDASGDSLVWREGFEDWRPLRDVEELSALIHKLPSPPPKPNVSPAGTSAGLRRNVAKPSAPKQSHSKGAATANGVEITGLGGVGGENRSQIDNVIPIASRLEGTATLVEENPFIGKNKTGIGKNETSETHRGSADKVSLEQNEEAFDSVLPVSLAGSGQSFEEDVDADIAASLPVHSKDAPAANQAELRESSGRLDSLPVESVPASVPAVSQRRPLPIGAWMGIVGSGSFGIALAVLLAPRLIPEPESSPPQPASVATVPTKDHTARSAVPVIDGLDEGQAFGSERATTAAPVQKRGRRNNAANLAKRNRSSGDSSASSASSPSATSTLSAQEEARLARFAEGADRLPGNVRVPRGANTGGANAPRGEGLSAAQLRTVVGRNRPALQRCYEQAIRGIGSPPATRINVEATVSMGGTVTMVRAKGNGIGSLNTCIEGAVRRWRFPAAGNVTPLSFPVVFQPGA